MNGMPNLTIPWPGEDGPLCSRPTCLFTISVLALLVIVYLALRAFW